MTTTIRTILLGAAVLLCATSFVHGTLYEDFETDAGDTPPDNNGIEGTRWLTINDNWHRNNFGGEQARSQATGEPATGSLISAGISVPSGEWLSFDGNGFFGNGGNSDDRAFGASLINVINVRQNSAGGTIIAQIVPDQDPRKLYRVDPRGATTLYIEAIDASTAGGYGWIGLDNVQTVAAPVGGVRITNGGFESGLAGWTIVSGSLSDASRHVNDPVGGGYEGGSLASSKIDGEPAVAVLRSPAISATHDTLTFATVGFGALNLGFTDSYYRLLDDTLTPIAGSEVAPPNSDNWSLVNLSLLSLGLSPGETFYLEMLDQRNGGGFSWLGLDEVRLTGVLVPEPSSVTLAAIASFAVVLNSRRKRRVS